MRSRIKIRMLTWYWGNYVTYPQGKPIPKDFELYEEDKHGWHLSEEYSMGHSKPFNQDMGKWEEL